MKREDRDFGPLRTAMKPLQRGGFPQRKCILNYICTEIIFMKYKEEIQVKTTVNEFLRFHTNPSNHHYANYHEIRSHMRRFIICTITKNRFCHLGNPRDSKKLCILLKGFAWALCVSDMNIVHKMHMSVFKMFFQLDSKM